MGDIEFEPQTEGCFCTPEHNYRINFHCGAWLYCGGPKQYEKGMKLIVYASKCVGSADRPKTMQGKAQCLIACPCKTVAERQETKAWGVGQEEKNEEPGWVVTCKIESIDKPSLCILCRKRRCQIDEDELCNECFGRNRK